MIPGIVWWIDVAVAFIFTLLLTGLHKETEGPMLTVIFLLFFIALRQRTRGDKND